MKENKQKKKNESKKRRTQAKKGMKNEEREKWKGRMPTERSKQIGNS